MNISTHGLPFSGRSVKGLALRFALLLSMFLMNTTVQAENENPLSKDYSFGLSTNSLSDLGVLVVSQPSYTTCDISLNGELRAIGFNGVPPYSYLWSNGATTAEIDGLGLGTYTVVITDETGETASASGEITLHPEGVWIMIMATGACDNQNNGTAHATATLGTEPYTYEWSDGQSGPDATGLSEGEYTVTATDAFGCTNSERIYIQGNDGIDVFLTSTYETCVGSNDAKITAIVSGGQEPYTYLWSDGQTTQIATGLGAGDYSVTVTDSNGCSEEETETVELSPEGLWIMITGTDTNCGEMDGSIHVGVMTGVPPYDFNWDDPSIGNTPDPTGLGAGTYEVTVSDDNGCTAVGSVTINSSSQINLTTTSTDATCDNGGTASVIIDNGTPSFNILWSNNATSATISDLDPGVYTVEVTDSEGCFGTATVIIEDTCDPCDADAGTLIPDQAPDCLNGPTTISATPDGNAVVPSGFTIVYVLTSGNGLVIQDTSPNPQFDVTVGGIYTIHTLVYDPNTLDLSIIDFGVTTGFDINELLEQGGGDICAALDVDGARFDLATGFTIDIIPQNPSICAGASVEFSITPTSASYSYSWTTTGGTFDNPNSSSPTYTMMMPGTYTISVAVLDMNTGCEAEASTTVTVIPNPDIGIEPSGESICSGGSLIFSATGVPANSAYEWSATGGSFDNTTVGSPTWTMMMPGTYTVSLTITTVDGCQATASTTARVNANPTNCTAEVTSSYFEGAHISSFGGSDGSAQASATGAGPLTYLWSNGATTASIDGLSAGTYDVVISDANGCSCTASVTLVDPSKVGNLVWLDNNMDGIQDADEPGLEGVFARLSGFTSDGSPVTRSDTTDVAGRYTFDGLLPGTYALSFEAPSGHRGSPINQGTDDTIDSDADPITGMTEMIDLVSEYCDNNIDAGFYECVNIGDKVWWDENHNGVQDPDEIGVEGVVVKLISAGIDLEFCTADDVIHMETTTDADGMYLFECVPPTDQFTWAYSVWFMTIPDDWQFTDQYVGNDELDSNADPETGKSEDFGVVAGQMDDLSIDAGIRPICDNFFGGGGEIISSDEEVCEGDILQTILSVVDPSGGSGPIEYLWLFRPGIPDGTWMPPAGFTELPNSNSLTYTPGPLFETTTFIRCARRADCPDFLESNYVTIEVIECGGTGTSSSMLLIGNLNSEETAQLNWEVAQEDDDYNFFIQKSYDGERFFDVSNEKGLGNTGETNNYDFMDSNTKHGLNYYRIKAVGLNTGISYSNEVALRVAQEILVDVYPNPFVDRLTLTPVQNLQEDLIVEIFNEAGQLIFSNTFDKDSKTIAIDVTEKEHDIRQLILRLRHPNLSKQKVLRVLQMSK